jgi:protein phosphatase
MSFVLASAARATTGARSGQEDAFRLWPPDGLARPKGEDGGLLAVLADGMGGHTGGAIAGQTACSMFAEVFTTAKIPYEERLQSALTASNEALARGVEENAALKGMGCTLIGVWIDGLGVRWTSVGDSLLLLYRFPDVIRLNADHSLGSFLDEQARQNRITEAEAKQHHNRNALRSALTGSKIDLIDLRSEPMELRPGDWILLASDGICSLEGDEIADVVYNFRQRKPEEMAEGLIAAVLKKGVAGQDNTTVVAVRVDATPDGASEGETTRVLRRPDDEQELRSRRIGITGRTSVPRPRRNTRSVVWFMAAAVFFLFFAATVLLRSWQTVPPEAPETAAPAKVQPTPALATPSEPTPRKDAPDNTDPDARRLPPAEPPAQPAPKSAMPPLPKPAAPPAPKSTTPDVPEPAAPAPKSPAPAAPAPQDRPGPVPQDQPAPAPTPHGTGPADPPQTAPSDTPQGIPPTTPGARSGEVQDERSQRATKTKTRQEGEERQRPRRRDQQTKEAGKEPARPQPKAPPKAAPKEAPVEAPREPARPWGFGND